MGGNERPEAIDREDMLDDLIPAVDGDVESTALATAVVKMKLATVCKSEHVKRILVAAVKDGNRLLAEGYVFANFHMLRLLREGEPIPKVDRNFYYRCLLAVSITNARKSTLGEEFGKSITVFDDLRPPNQSKVYACDYNQLIADLSIQMATMASNHLWTNVQRRAASYARWKYPALKGTWSLIARAVSGDEPSPELIAIKAGAKLASVSQAIADIKEKVPPSITRQARCKAHEMLPFYHRILSDTEAASERAKAEGRKFRGKAFTILPMKSSFTTSSVPISSAFFKALLKKAGLSSHAGDGRNIPNRSFWGKHINLNAFETRTRRFDDRIITDGCSVGLQIAKPSCIVSCPTMTCGCEAGGEACCRQVAGWWASTLASLTSWSCQSRESRALHRTALPSTTTAPRSRCPDAGRRDGTPRRLPSRTSSPR